MIYQPAIVVHGREAAEKAILQMQASGIETACIDPQSETGSDLFGVVAETAEGEGARIFATEIDPTNAIYSKSVSCPDCGSHWVLYPLRPQNSPSADALGTVVRGVSKLMGGERGHEYEAQCKSCGKAWYPEASPGLVD
jgi:hypothetical protein